MESDKYYREARRIRKENEERMKKEMHDNKMKLKDNRCIRSITNMKKLSSSRVVVDKVFSSLSFSKADGLIGPKKKQYLSMMKNTLSTAISPTAQAKKPFSNMNLRMSSKRNFFSHDVTLESDDDGESYDISEESAKQ